MVTYQISHHITIRNIQTSEKRMGRQQRLFKINKVVSFLISITKCF